MAIHIMKWIPLTTEEQLAEIQQNSGNRDIIIFKHSTRCSISATALNRLERSWIDTEMSEIEPYYLDLIQYRNISGKIAELFSVQHESPQLLLIRDGKCVYHDSHWGISYDELKEKVAVKS